MIKVRYFCDYDAQSNIVLCELRETNWEYACQIAQIRGAGTDPLSITILNVGDIE